MQDTSTRLHLLALVGLSLGTLSGGCLSAGAAGEEKLGIGRIVVAEEQAAEDSGGEMANAQASVRQAEAASCEALLANATAADANQDAKILALSLEAAVGRMLASISHKDATHAKLFSQERQHTATLPTLRRALGVSEEASCAWAEAPAELALREGLLETISAQQADWILRERLSPLYAMHSGKPTVGVNEVDIYKERWGPLALAESAAILEARRPGALISSQDGFSYELPHKADAYNGQLSETRRNGLYTALQQALETDTFYAELRKEASDACIENQNLNTRMAPATWRGVELSVRCLSPLVVDLDRDGIVTRHDVSVDFDVDADGSLESLGWIDEGDAWLVIDHNGNGLIDDGAELFGEGTRLSDGSRAEHGFAALAELDLNGDSFVDAAEMLAAGVQLWLDDGDGLTQPGELVAPADAGLVALGTSFVERDTRDAAGNWLRFHAHAYDNAGGSMPLIDVFFVTTPLN